MSLGLNIKNHFRSILLSSDAFRKLNTDIHFLRRLKIFNRIFLSRVHPDRYAKGLVEDLQGSDHPESILGAGHLRCRNEENIR